MKKILAWLKKWFSCNEICNIKETPKSEKDVLSEIQETQAKLRKFLDR